jgi:hypothetical protein
MKTDNVKLLVYTQTEWESKAIELFGPNVLDWEYECPNCGNIQTMRDFLPLKKKLNIDPEQAYFSCIGRYTDGQGTIFNNKRPCDYTNGGVFKLSHVSVLPNDSSHPIPVFPFHIKSSHTLKEKFKEEPNNNDMPYPKSGMQEQINEFNDKYPIGTPVKLLLDSGKITQTKVRAEAIILGGHSPVAWFEGVSGCYLITRVLD